VNGDIKKSYGRFFRAFVCAAGTLQRKPSLLPTWQQSELVVIVKAVREVKLLYGQCLLIVKRSCCSAKVSDRFKICRV
jgi:hypothetical protein